MPKFTVITPDAVKEIQELVQYRTPGDWRWLHSQRGNLIVQDAPDLEFVLEASDQGAIYRREGDSKFIAYAPEIIDSFLRYYEATEKMLRSLGVIAWDQHQAWMKALVNLADARDIPVGDMYLVMDEEDRSHNRDFALFMTDHPELAGRRP